MSVRNRPKILHCDGRKRFVVRADEKLTALMELESVTRARRLEKQVRFPTGSIMLLFKRTSLALCLPLDDGWSVI
jgi:hypothetical protein